MTSINIGAGGDGKYILLGADGNHVATDGNDLDAAGDPAENCHQVVARFHDVDVTVFPTIWNVPVISQSYTCSVEKTNRNFFKNHDYFMIGTQNY